MADSDVIFQLSVPGSATSNTTVGDFVHNFFGYDYGFIWWCPLIVLGYCVFFRAGASLLIAYVSYNKR